MQGPGPERGDLLVEVLGHHRHLRLRQPCDPERPNQLVHPAGRHPEQVAGRDHRSQRRLGAAVPLQEPVREERPFADLGDRDVDGAGAGVEVTVAVAVAGVDPVRASGCRTRRRTRVSACADSSALMNVPSSSRIRSGLAWASCSCKKTSGSIMGFAVIAVSFFESVVRDHSKDHSGDRTCMRRTRSPGSSYTNVMDSTDGRSWQVRISLRESRNAGAGRACPGREDEGPRTVSGPSPRHRPLGSITVVVLAIALAGDTVFIVGSAPSRHPTSLAVSSLPGAEPSLIVRD